jgi:dihydroorotate dehydrogenase electron transfer subunit
MGGQPGTANRTPQWQEGPSPANSLEPLPLGIGRVDLVVHLGVILPGPARSYPSLHEAGEAGQGIAGRGQFSLHRYMKCGVGLRGFCAMDPGGVRVCREGPAFICDQLIGTGFGVYSRDGSGRRRPVP